ncbi:hypothetical protein SAMN05892883_0870 [Jatrophihabitans sp. GAS493]|uniref:hypothetical protein n=1 Tax=Jatrophihabitans sp. GAS493 TaxID=1907575 RepID=UPI000BBF7F33|nr:hypothetical protein [Jatrophihabitans sp. GAS493]SOD71334.1 hypothetical protein SAMN05892883_0870 [Jatrophihabitans sp. GAS493]
MAAQRWVTTLLRARAANEDLAKQRLGAARRREQETAAHAASERRRASGRAENIAQSTPAFLASIVARQAAAATADQAHRTAERARVAANQSLDDLVEAARGRRTAEELLERQTAAALAHEKLAGERELDEIAAVGHAKKMIGGRG